MTTTAHTINDGDQITAFTGDLLGVGSSLKSGASRWHEVRIYRTTGGRYIVHKIGRSVLPGEVDRHAVKVCDRPEGVRAALTSRDRAGTSYLTRVATEAWRRAVNADADLMAAVQMINVA